MNRVVLFILFISVGIINSCGIKKISKNYASVKLLSVKEIVEGASKKNKTPNYLSIMAKIKYETPKLKGKLHARIRMKTNEKIWINISYIGISVARIVLMPNKIDMYDRRNKTYFSGDFKYILSMFGVDLNFYNIQSLILGNAIKNIDENKYRVKIIDNLYLLEDNTPYIKYFSKTESITNKYWYDVSSLQLEKQIIPLSDNKLEVTNRNFKIIDDKYSIPKEIKLKVEGDTKTTITITYTAIHVEDTLSFPFRVPSKYTKFKTE